MPNVRERQFRFENSWIREAGCEDIMRSSWANSGNNGIQGKLKKCGQDLQNWGHNLAHQIHVRIKQRKDIIS